MLVSFTVTEHETNIFGMCLISIEEYIHPVIITVTTLPFESFHCKKDKYVGTIQFMVHHIVSSLSHANPTK